MLSDQHFKVNIGFDTLSGTMTRDFTLNVCTLELRIEFDCVCILVWNVCCLRDTTDIELHDSDGNVATIFFVI